MEINGDQQIAWYSFGINARVRAGQSRSDGRCAPKPKDHGKRRKSRSGALQLTCDCLQECDLGEKGQGGIHVMQGRYAVFEHYSEVIAEVECGINGMVDRNELFVSTKSFMGDWRGAIEI